MAWLYTGAAVALLPWIAYLAVTLPTRDVDLHYRAAWVGFDCLLVLAIVRTAYMAFRIDPRVQFPAMATATLLFVDAWFDVTTANGRGATFEALLLAVGVEIPAALFSLHVPPGQPPGAPVGPSRSADPRWPGLTPDRAAPAGCKRRPDGVTEVAAALRRSPCRCDRARRR